MMRSLEKFWKACNKIKIRVGALFVLYTNYLVTHNIWSLVRCSLCNLCIAFQGLRKRKMNEVIQDGKYIAG